MKTIVYLICAVVVFGSSVSIRIAAAQDDMAPVPYNSGPTTKPGQNSSRQTRTPAQLPRLITGPIKLLSPAFERWLDQQYSDIVRDIGFWMATGKSYESATEEEKAKYDMLGVITTDRNAAIDFYNQHVDTGIQNFVDTPPDPSQTNYDDSSANSGNQPPIIENGNDGGDDDSGE